jgi:hypothetical protein
MNLFDLIMLCIYSFGLGWIMNDLTKIPTLYVAVACLVVGMAILVMKNKKARK